MVRLPGTDGFLTLKSGADPASVFSLFDAEDHPRRIQIAEPLSDDVLDAVAQALAAHPEVALRFYGFYEGVKDADPKLQWLGRFSSVRDLSIELWEATSFDVLSSFKNLRRLSLGQTKSTKPSLSFIRDLPNLESLSIDAHDRDFEAIAEASALRRLRLRVPRVKRLDAVRGHPHLELLAVDFGGIRDLTPLSEIAHLQALELYQVRGLDTSDFAAVGDCESLVGISLGALRNVRNLSALSKKPARTLRFLTIEHMLGLDTLRHLAECTALEQLYLGESKPKDGRLDFVASAPNLQHLIVGDAYSKEQLTATETAFKGKTLAIRGNDLRGQAADNEIVTRWRTPIGAFLDAAAGL